MTARHLASLRAAALLLAAQAPFPALAQQAVNEFVEFRNLQD